MTSVNPVTTVMESLSFPSEILGRELSIDFYFPKDVRGHMLYDVMLVNDGQDLQAMNFESILRQLYQTGSINPVLCVGIHAGPLRKFEYGTAISADYKGRGNLARSYTDFIIRELIPAIHLLFPDKLKNRWAFAGFSLGALSALDISWRHGSFFNRVGIFSGSLWWRTVDKDDPFYQDEQHRIMHNQIRDTHAVPGMRFFFECGTEDETEDRNGNGVIDSIDDTKDLIAALEQKGYDPRSDLFYYEIEGGKHDVLTWSKAFPVFLQWAFGKLKA